jgi:hypothetical protein
MGIIINRVVLLTRDKKMIVWERRIAKFTNDHVGRIGRVSIFTIAPSMIPGENVNLYCSLPGMKKHISCETEDEAKEKAEKMLNNWLKATGLNKTQGT